MFVSRSQDLGAGMNQIKTQANLRDFAVSINNLLEPGMSDSALKAFEQFVIEKAGRKMRFPVPGLD